MNFDFQVRVLSGALAGGVEEGYFVGIEVGGPKKAEDRGFDTPRSLFAQSPAILYCPGSSVGRALHVPVPA